MSDVYRCSNGIVLVIPEGAQLDIESIVNAKKVPNPLNDLTKRQREVIEMVAKAMSNQQIANELSISIGAVKRIVYNAYRTLGVKNRVELIRLLLDKNNVEK